VTDKTQEHTYLNSFPESSTKINLALQTFTMRISWGYKILVAYLSFAGGILFLAYKSSQQKFDLVTENYYEAELKYQDVIDQRNNAASLSAAPQIMHTVNSLSVRLPAEFQSRNVKGEIFLYRASDKTKDTRQQFETANGFYEAKFDRELSGAYALKLSWETAGKKFYIEKSIFF